MARLFDKYRVARRDNLGDPDFWNRRFEDLDIRLHARELDGAKIDGAVDALTAVALQRLDDTFTPVVESAIARLESVGALFSAESLSEETIGLGTRNLVLTEATRAAYVETAFVVARPVSDPDVGMVCRVDSFERSNGLMVLTAVTVFGAGTHSAWTIGVSAPPDLEHESRVDNPHETTAAQVGAYTTAATDALLATKANDAATAAALALKAPLASPALTGTPTAPTPSTGDSSTKLATTALVQAKIDALVAAAPGALDTLNELATALGGDASFSTTVLTALTKRVRADAATAFTIGEQSQARSNISAAVVENGAAGLAANNLIINGAMEVSDELGFASGTTPGVYAEQWRSDWVISTGSITTQVASQPSLAGFNRYLGLTATAGVTHSTTGYAYIVQSLTGSRMQRLRWGVSLGKPVKVGFWLFSTATGVASVGFRRVGSTHAYATSVTVTAANNWVWYTITVPAETAQSWVADDTKWGDFFVTAAAGSTFFTATPNAWVASNAIAVAAQTNLLATAGNLVALTGVVILPADVEMPAAAAAYLAQPPLAQMRDECRRFWESIRANRMSGTGFGSNNILMVAPFLTKKRSVTPSLSLLSTAANVFHDGTAQLGGTLAIANSVVSAESAYLLLGPSVTGSAASRAVVGNTTAQILAVNDRI